MRLLKKMHRSRNASPAAGSPFDLKSPQHLEQLNRLLAFSHTPQVSIHFEELGQPPQTTTLRYPILQPPSEALSSQTVSTSQASATLQAPSTLQVLPLDHLSLNPPTNEVEPPIEYIYAVGSYTKILINVAFERLLSHEKYKQLGISWQTTACDIFNEMRERKGKSTIVRLWGNPEIRQLLVHENGFAPMNRYLFAPDSTFIMSEDEFISVAPLITEDFFREKYPHRGWVQYSNANHIFAGMILEEVTGRKLHEVMHELVFEPLNMTHTIMDEQSLAVRTAGAVVVTGYRISANKSQTTATPNRYLSDVVEVAALGARSSTQDIGKLNCAFLKGAEGERHCEFEREEIADFFHPYCKLRDGEWSTLGGLLSALESEIASSESLNSTLLPRDFSPYTLGKRRDKSHCNAYYKAGSIDGFSSSVYFLLKDRAVVVVLGNSSGPLDVTDHIARYIIQEAFRLSPRVDIVSRAIEEGHICSERVQSFERQDLRLSTFSDNVEDLVGTYQHVRYLQQITVTREGTVTIHGTAKTSSPMKLVRVSPKEVRILPGTSGFTIDRWSAWEALDFTVDFESKSGICLVGNNGLDRYRWIR
jgi:CubicO group peptidase (beta-lactamase class C family)